MNYSELTDFEINKLVGFKKKSIKKGRIDNFYLNFCPDYCNNPSDAWPIILENKIDIAFLKCEPDITVASNGDDYIRDKNPLRAAMIVYLMMGVE